MRGERWDAAVRGDLDDALRGVRATLATAGFPFELPGAAAARQSTATLLAELDDYLIPRLRRIDAPLLAVVGGSTGAGKSTLVNSLVRAPVSVSGVLRPTTRGPVLVCHPEDGVWFGERSLLAGLARSNRPGEGLLQVVSAPELTAGLALLDAPDIDSVVAANRALAHELFAAADLWLFVTTAARYADAVPWGVLRGARDRGTVIAIVLDRVPPPVRDEIATDFARMLHAQDLGSAPLFVVRESTLDGHGLIGEPEVATIKEWLDAVASSAPQRRRVTRRTLIGAVATARQRVDGLARAADDQAREASTVAVAGREPFVQAVSDVEASLRGGSMLRGEVFSQWQELIASGELRTALRMAERPRRPRRAAPGSAEPLMPGRRFQAALAEALAALVTDVDLTATERLRARWREAAAGRELLAQDDALGRPWPGFTDAAYDLVHGWQQWLRGLARTEAPRVRTATRSYGTAATVLLGTVAAVAPPAADITAPGLAPDMLRAVVENESAYALGERARGEFLIRVGQLLSLEAERHLAAVSAVGVDPGLGTALREGSARLGMARSAFATLDAA